MTERRTPLEDTVKRLINVTLLLIALVVLILAAGGASAVYIVNTNKDTRDSLCTLRGDLESRVEQTRDYLDKHPEGFPGVSARQLSESIRNQDRTVDALGALDCP